MNETKQNNIKFRTFSKDYNRYFNVGAIDFINEKIKLELFGVNNSEWLPLEDFELEQSTGLQDKNGRDIYVGDIVFLNDIKLEVIYNQETASYRLHKRYSHIDLMNLALTIDKTARIEIISNINKNPRNNKEHGDKI